MSSPFFLFSWSGVIYNTVSAAVLEKREVEEALVCRDHRTNW